MPIASELISHCVLDNVNLKGLVYVGFGSYWDGIFIGAVILVATTIAIVSKTIGVSSHPCYRWRKEHGGLRVEQAKKLKLLKKENARLKKLVADLSLNNAILKEAAEGNF